MLETDEVDEVFTDCGITSLRTALSDRTVGELHSPEHLTFYARVAVAMTAGTVTADLRGRLQGLYADLLGQVFGLGDLSTTVVDGVEYVEDPISGGRVEVTESTIQHWEWLNTLCLDDEVVEELLRQVPAEVRADAERTAAIAVDGAFAKIVEDFEAE